MADWQITAVLSTEVTLRELFLIIALSAWTIATALLCCACCLPCRIVRSIRRGGVKKCVNKPFQMLTRKNWLSDEVQFSDIVKPDAPKDSDDEEDDDVDPHSLREGSSPIARMSRFFMRTAKIISLSVRYPPFFADSRHRDCSSFWVAFICDYCGADCDGVVHHFGPLVYAVVLEQHACCGHLDCGAVPQHASPLPADHEEVRRHHVAERAVVAAARDLHRLRDVGHVSVPASVRVHDGTVAFVQRTIVSVRRDLSSLLHRAERPDAADARQHARHDRSRAERRHDHLLVSERAEEERQQRLLQNGLYSR